MMRLLNTKTLRFEDFYGEIPEYAILSHRWEKEEVTYQDVANERQHTLQGWYKILACCMLASSRGLKYAWVDTCCINKESSAELTESINSMYKWYENAAECYAYLSDVSISKIEADKDQFCMSKWFSRGWTLQELIAPSRVYFYNRRWEFLGSKTRLSPLLEQITHIDSKVLSGEARPSDYTVSRRMAWAAERTTTRVEDRAYSLLGLFNINMPMLYGEGEKAFHRLQQEIMKQSDDQTIFAWRNASHVKSVLAPSPSCFTSLGDMIRIKPTDVTTQASTVHIVNSGLSIELHLIPWTMNTYLAPLRCGYMKPSDTYSKQSRCLRNYHRACIFLQQTDHDSQFVRVAVDHQDLVVIDGDEVAKMRKNLNIQEQRILIKQSTGSKPLIAKKSYFYGYTFSFKHPALFTTGRTPRTRDALCSHTWSTQQPLFEIQPGGQHTAGIFRLSGISTGLYLYLGFDLDFSPLVLISTRQPPIDRKGRLPMLPSELDKVSQTEANRLLDLNWLRSQVARGPQAGETILAYKCDRRQRTEVKCESLSLLLTFETRKSEAVGQRSWHVDFDYLKPSGSTSSKRHNSPRR